ncbi:hypothetical protein A2982_03380 [candidate division WWE3 bacterium RIFCSPLOWO2_01_FULL_39_13]|uniref:DUF2975 domain-containing protein n=1 Tax=candidate division WWE3 bacterium RIFCSPLOWO2_01_FULL_39_13 TaxID=1802624 RepID=A0A1F4V3B9_UNCKA|nr:MAG: hypothetical protein A2982_03380 [candidate division WWE3 bacterium RIFCSPLOWO2_01_FULL_39_13]
MYSKTLVKLIDYAIFPAVLLVFVKITAIVFLANYMGASYNVEGFRLIFTTPAEYIEINTYSSLFMYIAVVAGLIWVVVKAHIFHDTHISPRLSARLLEMDMSELIEATEIIFSQAFVWLSYAWITTIIFGFQAYFGLSSYLLFWGAFTVTILSSAMLLIDLEKEIITDRKSFEPDSPRKPKVIKFEEIKEEILV